MTDDSNPEVLTAIERRDKQREIVARNIEREDWAEAIRTEMKEAGCD